MCTPNFFSDAPESLQDAFIRWLVACAIQAPDPLHECGLAFVRALFRAGSEDGTMDIPVLDSNGNLMAPYNGPCEVSDVCTPIRQYGKEKIDVYFQAKVDGEIVSFPIEDKINTQYHSNQLERSLDYVINDDQDEDLIKPVYFKTGYVFSDERETVIENKYSFFEAEDLKNFLDCHPDAIQESEILCQYAKYLNDKKRTRVEAFANWDLNQDYVQWEFLRKLRRVLRNADGEWQGFVPDELSGEHELEEPDGSGQRWKNGLGRGNNLNFKSPWTQYWFSKHLFWRLDRKPWLVNPNLRVQLRLMISLKNAGMNYGEIQEYQVLFNQARQQEELRTGNVRRVRSKNECTIGSVDIVNETDIANETTKFQGLTEDEFLDRVKRVHIRFLESISQI